MCLVGITLDFGLFVGWRKLALLKYWILLFIKCDPFILKRFCKRWFVLSLISLVLNPSEILLGLVPCLKP